MPMQPKPRAETVSEPSVRVSIDISSVGTVATVGTVGRPVRHLIRRTFGGGTARSGQTATLGPMARGHNGSPLPVPPGRMAPAGRGSPLPGDVPGGDGRQSADMTKTRERRKGWLRRAAPGFDAVATYQKDWFGKDIVAGVVLTTLLVPQGMAYAELAGLPPITGLYTSILCLLAYAVFGPSRVASGGDPQKAIALASMLALMVGAIMVLASVAKLGFIADLISKPTMIGYMNGLAITILVGQLPKLFGFKVESENFLGDLVGFVEGVANGETVVAAAAVGIGGIVLILVLQRWLPKVPAVLVMVVLAIAAAVVFDLAAKGVSLVGELPQGFPPFTIPQVDVADLGLMFAGALGIALVSLTDTISTSTAFAARTGQEIRGNQEMIGIGAANLAAGLFQGFPVSTSGSRTAVAERAGARTQLTGVTGAVLIIVMIVLLPGLFRNLPQPALAAIVITAALSLADLPATARLWRQRRVEFALSMTAFAGVALL